MTSRNARNHGSARRAPWKTSTKTGATNDQTITPLDGMKPPSAMSKRSGMTRMIVAIRKVDAEMSRVTWTRASSAMMSSPMTTARPAARGSLNQA